MIQGRWKDQRTARQYLDDARATLITLQVSPTSTALLSRFRQLFLQFVTSLRKWRVSGRIWLWSSTSVSSSSSFMTLVWLGWLWCSFYFLVISEIKFTPFAGVLWYKIDFRFSFPNLIWIHCHCTTTFAIAGCAAKMAFTWA